MENIDSKPKQAALDNKSAFAGNVSSDPEIGVTQLGTDAGLDIQPEEPLAVAEKLAERDEQRFELDSDSAEATV